MFLISYLLSISTNVSVWISLCLVFSSKKITNFKIFWSMNLVLVYKNQLVSHWHLYFCNYKTHQLIEWKLVLLDHISEYLWVREKKSAIRSIKAQGVLQARMVWACVWVCVSVCECVYESMWCVCERERE